MGIESINNIENAFVKQFESEVHLAYQQTGTKLRSTVRNKDGVVGATTVFQRVGRGIASTKARNANVPTMNLDYTSVECHLKDYYAGDWVDALDEIKTNIDERHVIASAGAYALGRKTDDLIISELNKATQKIDIGTDVDAVLTKEKVMAAIAKLNANEVPDDGQRFGIVGVKQWNDLLNIEEFSSGAYVGENYPFLSGFENRKWMGVVWLLHTELPFAVDINDATKGTRTCFVYHRYAIGHACGQDVKTDIFWNGEKAAHFISNSMSQGSAIIDNTGAVKIPCEEGIDATV